MKTFKVSLSYQIEEEGAQAGYSKAIYDSVTATGVPAKIIFTILSLFYRMEDYNKHAV